MPHNEFDALLDDVAVVQKLRATGELRKALAQVDPAGCGWGERPDEARARRAEAAERHRPVPVSTLDSIAPAVARRQAQAARATRERAALDRIMAKAEPIMTRRQRFERTVPEIMAKAMNLLQEGKIGAVEISRLEARVHALDLAVRP